MHDPKPCPARTGVRRRIVDAATHCCEIYGFYKTTVEDIALAASVSKGTVYGHFASKTELLQAVVESALEDWSASWRSSTSVAATAPAALRSMLLSLIDLALERPLLRVVLGRESELLPADLREPARPALEEWREYVVELVTAGIARGELGSHLDPHTTADVVCFQHLAYIDRLVSPARTIDLSDPKIAAAGVEALIRGLAISSCVAPPTSC